MRTRPLVIGHRGNAGPAPANTLVGYEQAINMGLDMIEVDVRVTSDGELVLIHDDKVDDTTNGQGRVDSMTLPEIRRLDAGSWKSGEYAGQRVPTLAEALELARGRIRVSLDLKDERAIPRMAHAVSDADMFDEVVVCGCDVRWAEAVRRVEPRFSITLNMDSDMKALADTDYARFTEAYIAQAADAGLAALNMSDRYITAELVREAHQHCLPVWAWTVDDPVDIRRVVAMGVDAIYSNWPERVLDVLRS